MESLLSCASQYSESTHSYNCIKYNNSIPCSNGIGRTGAFICMHAQIDRLKTEGVIDFFQYVKSARIQRSGLVDDKV